MQHFFCQPVYMLWFNSSKCESNADKVDLHCRFHATRRKHTSINGVRTHWNRHAPQMRTTASSFNKNLREY